MSSSDESNENYFSGFAELFDTLAQEHEDNIFQAIRRYSILQGVDVTETLPRHSEFPPTLIISNFLYFGNLTNVIITNPSSDGQRQ